MTCHYAAEFVGAARGAANEEPVLEGTEKLTDFPPDGPIAPRAETGTFVPPAARGPIDRILEMTAGGLSPR